jgi:hypothetical protein
MRNAPGTARGRAAAGSGIYEVTDIALDVWVTDEQEGLISERVLPNLLMLCNPDAQRSVRATPPNTCAQRELNFPINQSSIGCSLKPHQRLLFLRHPGRPKAANLGHPAIH